MNSTAQEMLMSTQYKLKQTAERLGNRIKKAEQNKEYFNEPFQHIVIDDAIDTDLAEKMYGAFPPLNDQIWEHENDADIEIKARTKWKSEFDVPEHIVDAVRILNSSIILEGIAQRLSIPKLIPDPYFSGGGLNSTSKGGLLDVHVDGNYHDMMGLHRRVNAILYLNPGWTQDWGGEFGAYDENGDVLIKKIPPLFNRLVVFDTHDKSYHGLPDPINFPENVQRKSLILYYYTAAKRPRDVTEIEEPHSALWKRRGLVDKRGSKTRKHF
jgi:Rps23 Pro-64 3,4-dihydroxylase Tpa1-like proline 4-hydroxylase